MRAVILILILGVVALIIAVSTGLINVRQTRDAAAPNVSADASGVTAAGGQAPAFDIETGKVAVGAQDKNVTVKVPTIKVQRSDDANQATTANAAN
jgi:hypothetical protein